MHASLLRHNCIVTITKNAYKTEHTFLPLVKMYAFFFQYAIMSQNHYSTISGICKEVFKKSYPDKFFHGIVFVVLISNFDLSGSLAFPSGEGGPRSGG